MVDQLAVLDRVQRPYTCDRPFPTVNRKGANAAAFGCWWPALFCFTIEAMEGVELGSGNTEFLAKAADAIHIKLGVLLSSTTTATDKVTVSTQEDVDEGESFHPEFTHQVVGQRYDQSCLSIAPGVAEYQFSN